MIHQATSQFDFSKIVLTNPLVLPGGNFMLKCRMDENPLYIQTPKCSSKSGIVKNGKHFFCDLLFTNEHETWIQWMERFQEHIQIRLFENRSRWFETELDETDIENSMTPPLKLYKSGKFYICRTIIPNSELKIYDENEKEITMEEVSENDTLISILEVVGIKCSPRNFQIEFEIKQMMVVRPSKIFAKCSITPTISTSAPTISTPLEDSNEPPITEPEPIEPIHLASNNELLEIVDIELDGTTVQLKRRNEVYYEMYKEARIIARKHRDLAIKGYLEAKDIKNTNYLSDVGDADDLDEPFEEFIENNRNMII